MNRAFFVLVLLILVLSIIQFFPLGLFLGFLFLLWIIGFWDEQMIVIHKVTDKNRLKRLNSLFNTEKKYEQN